MNILVVEPESDAFLGANNYFIKAGHNLKTIKFSSGIEPYRYITRLKNKLGFRINDYLVKKRAILNKRILDECRDYRPDVVLIRQGRHILPETVRQIAEKTFIALALSDMISLFPEIYDTFKYYNVIYSYDRADVSQLQNEGFNARFKPAGYNDMIYRKENAKKDCDIAFVGTMYKERVVLLRQLTRTFPNNKWEIYGEYAPLRMPLKWIKWRFSSEYKYFRNKYLKPDDVNKLYNRSKIVLNIVRANQRDGWSARLVQVSASGAFQITDYFDAVQKEYGDCVCLFKNSDELIRQIGYYLNHDEEREIKAKRGYEKVVKNASGHIVVDMIMEDYQKNKADSAMQQQLSERVWK